MNAITHLSVGGLLNILWQADIPPAMHLDVVFHYRVRRYPDGRTALDTAADRHHSVTVDRDPHGSTLLWHHGKIRAAGFYRVVRAYLDTINRLDQENR